MVRPLPPPADRGETRMIKAAVMDTSIAVNGGTVSDSTYQMQAVNHFEGLQHFKSGDAANAFAAVPPISLVY